MTFVGIGPFVWSNGADYFSAQRTKCTLTDPAAVEAVQYVADLYIKQRTAPRPSEPRTGLEWFPATTIAMQVNNITSTYLWRRDAQFEFDIVRNPKGKGGQIGLLNANGYGMLAGSKAQD